MPGLPDRRARCRDTGAEYGTDRIKVSSVSDHAAVSATTMADTMAKDTAFEMAVSSVRFGAGVTREVGMDLADLGARRALVITDPTLAAMRPVAIVMESLRDSGVPATLYDRVRVEPSDESFLDAIAFAARRRIRRVRRGRRRLDDRHREGGQPLHDVSARRFPRLREPADRQGPAGAGTAEAADRDTRPPPAPGARRPASASSTTARCTPRPASPTGGSSRRSASSIRTTRARCRRKWPPRPGSTS